MEEEGPVGVLAGGWPGEPGKPPVAPSGLRRRLKVPIRREGGAEMGEAEDVGDLQIVLNAGD